MATLSALRRILVPVDFSAPSKAALAVAGEMAQAFGAKIDLVHAIDVPSYAPPGQPLVIASPASQPLETYLLTRAGNDMADFRKELPEATQQHVDRIILEVGLPTERILDLVESGDYQLIVMGTLGRTGLKRLMLGSVAERVLRHSSCPVLTVKAPEADD